MAASHPFAPSIPRDRCSTCGESFDHHDDGQETLNAMRRRPRATSLEPPFTVNNLSTIEKVIGPAKRWKAKCYEISCKIVDAGLAPISSVAVYGSYYGPIDESSIFYDKSESCGFVRHGWISIPDPRLPEGWVLDPTRWVFEASTPYLYLAPHDESYDEGSQRLRAELRQHRGSPPTSKPEDRVYPANILSDEAWHVITSLLLLDKPRSMKTISRLEAFWIANASISEFEGHARAIYGALALNKLSALIPIDNYNRVVSGRAS